MHARHGRVEHRSDARSTAALVLLLALAGCALVAGPGASRDSATTPPYVGVFTGEYVDGKPLYRFPTLKVVGSRSTVGPGM